MKLQKIIAGCCSLLLLYSVPLQAAALDTACIGYGQGKATDSHNCPLDALSFNEQYAAYGAFATTPDTSRIILTFDQGYENGYPAQILDTLKEKQVTAIFFLTGDYAKKETALVQRMIAEGHVLGNHGMTHASLPNCTQAEAMEEIQSLHDYVLQTYDYEMQYFRCPCGEYSEQALQWVKDAGYQTVFWSGAYVDWKTDAQPDTGEAYETLLSTAHGGEILLLHSVSATNAAILGDVIDGFRAAGYTV